MEKKSDEAKTPTTSKVTYRRGENGEKYVNQYQILYTIGKGILSNVKLCRHLESSQCFAMKIYNKCVLKKKKDHMNTKTGLGYRTAYDTVVKEISIHSLLDHPNVIRLEEIIDDPECEKLYLVMEWAELGQILTWDPVSLKFAPYLKDTEYFTEKRVCEIVRDIARALKYLHGVGVVHRDIKPQNILVNEKGRAKLTDFSAAEKVGENDLLTKTAGTYQFFSPESCDSENTQGIPGRASDVWALGVTTYAMLYNRLPFWGDSIISILDAISTKPIMYLKTRTISKQLVDLIEGMLNKDPLKRFTVDQILSHQALNEL